MPSLCRLFWADPSKVTRLTCEGWLTYGQSQRPGLVSRSALAAPVAVISTRPGAWKAAAASPACVVLRTLRIPMERAGRRHRGCQCEVPSGGAARDFVSGGTAPMR
jgi:hypothetical protein